MNSPSTTHTKISSYLKTFAFRVFKRYDYTVGEVHAIYSTNVISGLAQSLLGIFTPIYIYQLSENYPVFSGNSMTNGFLWIMTYLGLNSLVVVLVSILSDELIFQWTLKKTMFYAQLFLIGSFAFLFLAETNIYFILIAAILGGVHTPYYWIPYHIFFVKKSDNGDKKYGTEIGNRDFLVGVASALGPFLGSLIIVQLGFPYLYSTAIFLLFISTFPILLFVREEGHRKHILKDVFSNYIRNSKYFITSIALGGSIISNTVFVIFWSMMLYFGLQSFVEIGILSTFSGALAMVLLIVVGRMIDKNGKSVIHAIGVTINTLLHLTRPFFNSVGFLYANGILDNVNAPAYNVPFNAKLYENSLKGSVSDFLVYREITLHVVRFTAILFMGVILFFTDSWMWVFYFGALGSLLTFLINI